MLSYIKWQIKNIELNSVIILTESWIWYEIIINELVYSNIYDKKNIELFLYHNITENSQNIFGFLNFEDRILFKELIKISWIWGRVAQNILSLWNMRLKKAILENNKKIIESIKWVWKKMAEKIVLELIDKDIIKNAEFEYLKKSKTIKNSFQIQNDLKKEIISTLTIMWYNLKKVEDILDNLPDWYNDIKKIIPYIIKNI